MKTEIKKIDATTKEIRIEEAGEVIKNKFDEMFKKIGEKAKVPGFRSGHVPKDILEKHFSQAAHQEVVNELIPELYHQAVEKENLPVLDLPKIEDVKIDRNTLSFKATVEVMPEVALKNYRGLPIEYQKVVVNADDVKRNIDSIKEMRKAETLDDSFAKVLGYPSLAELENAVEKQIYVQKENAQRHKLEHQLIEQLGKGLTIPLPKSLVSKHLEDLLRRSKIELAMRGMSREQIDEHEKKMLEELEPEARRQVEVYLMLATIAKKENIPLDDQMSSRVMELLFKEGDWKIS